MAPASFARFERDAACPETQHLLAFNDDTLSYLMRERIAEHLAVCDFCGACLHFLKTHPPTDELGLSAAVPARVLLLAQSLLPRASNAASERDRHAA